MAAGVGRRRAWSLSLTSQQQVAGLMPTRSCPFERLAPLPFPTDCLVGAFAQKVVKKCHVCAPSLPQSSLMGGHPAYYGTCNMSMASSLSGPIGCMRQAA